MFATIHFKILSISNTGFKNLKVKMYKTIVLSVLFGVTFGLKQQRRKNEAF